MQAKPGVVALLLILSLSPGAIACASNDDGVEDATPPATPNTPSVILAGHPGLPLGQAAVALNDGADGAFQASINDFSGDIDLLLVTVAEPDGPMPGLRDALEELDGRTLPRIAVLITNADELDDPELEQLVRIETFELRSYGISTSLELLQMPDADIARKVRALLALPGREYEIVAPKDVFVSMDHDLLGGRIAGGDTPRWRDNNERDRLLPHRSASRRR